MLAKVVSCAIVSLDADIVEVEVDIIRGFPAFQLVGLPDAAVRESRDRVHSAVKNSGLTFPTDKRITINLAPADLRKEGPAYDLPIAVGILAASQQVWPDKLEGAMFVGELSLDGATRHTKGILSCAALARAQGIKQLFVPAVNADEAALMPEITVFPVKDLAQLVGHLTGMKPISPHFINLDDVFKQEPDYVTDFADIMGQEHVKRAIEVAAAGGHNVLMTGPPGTGKTLIAKSVPSVLPRLSINEALEVSKIYSIAGLLPADTPLVRQRPFRSPHHTISYAGLVGGGAWPRPGEISLAHRGVLFLDELPEFGQNLIEVLRQPLEGMPREVSISRANGTVTFPANFMLIAAQNPCPCGYFGDPNHACSCTNAMITRYQKRISGPLLDRIDICVDVPRVDFDKLTTARRGEPSAQIRERVEGSRKQQRERLKATSLLSNAEMGPSEVHTFCEIDETGRRLMKSAMAQMNLSARAFHRTLKVARTIADLSGAAAIQTIHLAEALQYRPRSSN
ncbi:MAG: YifB family Mg chelatase-like AAA ATPase [Chloroflexi bacterium]|nr:YifB family Mg chelatase-like AAA ATPase [Chloroflexota bacterium]MBP8054708.1 YifB family Mg chelatase-like AAA ATPase [Chloroflexota bacterium]